MKFSRLLVIALTVVFLGMAAAGSAEAAQKSQLNQVSYRAVNVISGLSIHWLTLLKYWKSGNRFWFD